MGKRWEGEEKTNFKENYIWQKTSSNVHVHVDI